MAELSMKMDNGDSETSVVPVKDMKSKSQKWKETAIFFAHNITIEPLVFLFAIASCMQSVVIQALVSERTCLVTFGYGQDYCSNVTNASVQQELKGIIADYNFYSLVLESGPYIFLTIFAGSWSDQHSPKGLIFVNMAANIASGLVLTLVAYLKHVRPELTLIGHAIRGISGSHAMFYLAVYSYIMSNSTEKSRTTRLIFVEASYLLGTPIGTQSGAWLYGNRNYTLVFLVSTVIYVLSIPYALFVFRHLQIIVGSKTRALRGMFKLHHLKMGLQVVIKKRQGRKRIHIILTMICAKLLVFALTGDRTMFFPFVQIVFKLTVKTFSYYGVFMELLVLIGTLIGLPFMTYICGMNDFILGIIALFLVFLSEILTAISTTTLMLYLSSSLFIFWPAGHIVCRSLMSKCVSEDEQGKLISIYGLLSAILPIISSFIYDKMFRATMATLPGACLLLSAGIITLPILGFIWIYNDIKRHPAQEFEMQDEVVLVREDSDVELNKKH